MSAPMRVKVFSGDNYIKVTNEINAFLDSKDLPITKAQINTCCYSGSIFITLLYEVHKKPEPYVMKENDYEVYFYGRSTEEAHRIYLSWYDDMRPVIDIREKSLTVLNNLPGYKIIYQSKEFIGDEK